MTLEFAQSNHDAIASRFIDRVEAVNAANAFKPSALHFSIMSEFIDSHHRLTYLTKPGRLSLRPSVAAAALEELIDLGYMSFFKTEQKYALLKKGRDYVNPPYVPLVVGIKTPPRTYENATMRDRLVGVQMPVMRDGGNDNLLHKSMNPCAPQLQRVGV